MIETTPSQSVLHRSPLHALHVEYGGKMVPFAGYEMPLYYPSGILKEHRHTRQAVGLFDVSHMGQMVIRPRSGRMEDAAAALEEWVPADVVNLPLGRQRYALLTNENAGILDDLMIARHRDHLLLVVNASRKDTDEVHLRAGLADRCLVAPLLERTLLALQGPFAASVLASLAPESATMYFMDVRSLAIKGVDAVVSRSGYTGEDGFEISVAADRAEYLARMLLRDERVAIIGLGARDSLRLEAGLCLYGSDLDEMTTPVEAALEWAIAKSRRAEGTRAGGYPGAEKILKQLAEGAPRRRVGLKPDGRAPIRAGALLYRDEFGDAEVGKVTSGGFSPTLDAPIAMGYVTRTAANNGTLLFAELRGRRLPVRVAALPFVRCNYKRS
jgi:aminomethyltransferase